MALIDRIGGFLPPESEGRIAVRVFWAMLYEMAKGKISRQQIIDSFQLTGNDVTDLDWLIGRYNAQPNATAKASFVELMQVIFLLAEANTPGYTTAADIAARINAI